MLHGSGRALGVGPRGRANGALPMGGSRGRPAKIGRRPLRFSREPRDRCAFIQATPGNAGFLP
eukprot:8025251-Lingulodinium_polyedra.AAC.1